MKILITGANGQLGRELNALLNVEAGVEVVATDVAELDLTDAEAVRRFVEQGAFSHIVNCAAYTDVNRAEEEPALCAKVNTEAVKNLASAAYDLGVKVVHVSTDYVFDGTASSPYRESDKVNPLSQYGTSKRKGETLLLALCPDAIVVRTAWLYSPWGNNFVKTMLRLAREGKCPRVVADQIGTPTYAYDLARAIVAILTARQWIPGIYHFTDEGAASWYDLACMTFRLSGYDPEVITPVTTADYPTPAHRPAYSLLDKSLIKKTYNLKIPFWVDSLAACLERLNSDCQ